MVTKMMTMKTTNKKKTKRQEQKEMEYDFIKTNFEKILEEYTVDPSNEDDDQTLLLALEKLAPWKRNIFVIYSETASLRKASEILNVSHSFLNKIIKEIREELMQYIEEINNSDVY